MLCQLFESWKACISLLRLAFLCFVILNSAFSFPNCSFCRLCTKGPEFTTTLFRWYSGENVVAKRSLFSTGRELHAEIEAVRRDYQLHCRKLAQLSCRTGKVTQYDVPNKSQNSRFNFTYSFLHENEMLSFLLYASRKPTPTDWKQKRQLLNESVRKTGPNKRLWVLFICSSLSCVDNRCLTFSGVNILGVDSFFVGKDKACWKVDSCLFWLWNVYVGLIHLNSHESKTQKVVGWPDLVSFTIDVIVRSLC